MHRTCRTSAQYSYYSLNMAHGLRRTAPGRQLRLLVRCTGVDALAGRL